MTVCSGSTGSFSVAVTGLLGIVDDFRGSVRGSAVAGRCFKRLERRRAKPVLRGWLDTVPLGSTRFSELTLSLLLSSRHRLKTVESAPQFSYHRSIPSKRPGSALVSSVTFLD